jgi:UDP-N-acetylmuramoyl-tripeptide--D-alanyl-D-alanine ligase
LDTLVNLPAAGRRIAILGDMRELGRESSMHHREIGTLAVEGGGIDRLVCIGADAAHIADAAIESGMPAHAIQRFPDAASAALSVTALVHSGDLVLLKASRAMKLETVGAALTAFAQRTNPGSNREDRHAQEGVEAPAGGILPTPA